MPFITKDFYRTTRFKTTLWYAGLFLLLEVVIGIIIYAYLRSGLLKDLDESLSKQAQTIYEFVADPTVNLMNFEPDSIYESQEDLVFNLIFDAIVVNPRSTFIQVKLNGKPIFQTENLKRHVILINNIIPDRLSLISFNDRFLSDYELRAAYLLKDKYEIIVAFPTILIAKALQKLEELIIIIGPLFLLIAIIGGAIISAKSLSRIDSIINKTNEITAQNLDEKIPGGDREDEYGRLVRTMNDMISRIKKAIDYMEQFSTAASHELKTPLTILRGEIEVALKSPKPVEEYKQILKSNYEETLRLTNIVNKLFFISRVDSSLHKLKKEKIKISRLLQSVVDHMQTIAGNKNMRIVLDITDNFHLFVDFELMSTAITNLIDNAIKYGNANTTIKISAISEKPSWEVISVTNSGEVIPKEMHEKIFERFFRYETSRNRETGGAGLGLSIVKSIVALHNGMVKVTSGDGKETSFSIYLNSKVT
jgi:signal transduction histidine kinase